MRGKFKIISAVLVAMVALMMGGVANAVELDLSDVYGNDVVANLSIDELRQLLNGSVPDNMEELGVRTDSDMTIGTYLYFGKGDGSYGLRTSSGTLQYKNSGGSWSNLGTTAIAGGGWIADALNLYMVPTSNASGVTYPVVLGGTGTTSAWVSTDELFINGSFTSTGAANIDGALDVAGNVTMVNASSTVFTNSGATYLGGTLAVTGATTLTGAATLSSTLAVTGAATLSSTAAITGNVTVGFAIDTIGATALHIGTSTATSIEISDTAVTTNIQGPLTAAETVVVTGATTLSDTLAVTGAATLSSTLAADNTTINGSFTANEASENVDFRVETNGDEYAFFCEGSNDLCGFGTSTPLTEKVEISDGFQVFDSTSPYDVLIHGYDSSDDGVLDLLANNSVTVQLHANDSSYFIGGNFGIGTTTPDCGITVGDTVPSTACSGDDDVMITGTLEVDGNVDFDGSVNIAGNSVLVGTLGVTGVTTLVNASTTQLSVSGLSWLAGNVSVDGGTFTFNESSADLDFRAESNGNANMFFIDGGSDRVGIGTGTPGSLLDVYASTGTSTISIDGLRGNIRIRETDSTWSNCYLPAGATAFVCAGE